MSGQIVETEKTLNKLLFTQIFPIRWGEMDVLGHVNNAQYLRYFEESRTAWCESIGKSLRSSEQGMILLKATVTYKKPVGYPANAIVDLRAGTIGNSSFNLINTLTIEGEGEDNSNSNSNSNSEPACIGEFVIVWFDYVHNKPLRVPDDIRKILAP